MKTQKINPIVLLTLIPVMILTGSACENPSGADSNPNLKIEESQVPGAFFNPQPEPPGGIFEFELVGTPDGEWGGQFLNTENEGRMDIQTLSVKQQGNIIQIVQSWMVVPPEPIHPPGPNMPTHPPDPSMLFNLDMKGTLNFGNGTLVLNGMTEEKGENAANVHVRGDFITLENGSLSVGGEVMFNPQPEPPRPRGF